MTSDVLQSWRDTDTRRAIVDFVESLGDLPPEERVAVFDNDGTLWCEKPMPIELGFIASGGDWDFMRPVTQELYGIPLSGGQAGADLEPDRPPPDPGLRQLERRHADVELRRRPRKACAAAARLHDDPEREFAYTPGAERALDQARDAGWTVVSVRKPPNRWSPRTRRRR